MKKHLFLLLVFISYAALTASATLVAPFTTSPGVPLTTISALPTGTLVADTGTINFSFGTQADPNKNRGTLTEQVYRDASGFLFFVFQVSVTGGPNGNIHRLSSGEWDNSIKIDAQQYAPGSEINALSVDRNGLGTLGIFWEPDVVNGQTTSFVVLYTDATRVVPGSLGLIDTGSSPTIAGFVAATPEPTTLALLVLGAAGLGIIRRRQQN